MRRRDPYPQSEAAGPDEKMAQVAPHGNPGAQTRVLVVEDTPAMADIMVTHLGAFPVEVRVATGFRMALGEIRAWRPRMVIADVHLGDGEGTDLIDHVLEVDPAALVIYVTAYGTIPAAVNMMRRGAWDYLTKPFRAEQFIHTVERALRVAGLEAENASLRRRLDAVRPPEGMLGEAPAFLDAVRVATEIAATDLSVVLQGESGTGKELFARAIHDRSGRRERSFLALNCAAIPDTLLESELFGYRKGAFTGADQDRQGLVERAEGGTLFLDEVTETSAAFQAKLLRVLQEREFLPVGAREPVAMNVRVLAATNRNLAEAVRDGRFRQDLYYRLGGMIITLPALRDRPGDVLRIAQALLETSLARRGSARDRLRLSRRAKDVLVAHSWPGNIRELQHAVERAIALRQTGEIQPGDLFPPTSSAPGGRPQSGPVDSLPDMEKGMILDALKRARGNVSQAARLLGISRPTLRYRLKRLNRRG